MTIMDPRLRETRMSLMDLTIDLCTLDLRRTSGCHLGQKTTPTATIGGGWGKTGRFGFPYPTPFHVNLVPCISNILSFFVNNLMYAIFSNVFGSHFPWFEGRLTELVKSRCFHCMSIAKETFNCIARNPIKHPNMRTTT